MYIYRLYLHILNFATLYTTFLYIFTALTYFFAYLFVAVYMQMHVLLHINTPPNGAICVSLEAFYAN